MGVCEKDMSKVTEGVRLSRVQSSCPRSLARRLAPGALNPSHWGFGWPSRARSSCIMPGCARPNPCPKGLLLAGSGVPSGLRDLGSGGCSGWILCSGADGSSSGGGLGGPSGGSGTGVRRKEGRERRCEELRDRNTRLLETETSRRDPGSRASPHLP